MGIGCITPMVVDFETRLSPRFSLDLDLSLSLSLATRPTSKFASHV
jgi:hypothetical protein